MTERKATIILLNDIQCQITGLGSYDLECLYDEYGLFVKNHFFMPAVKLGTWDGKKRLVTRDGTTYIYLLKTIVPKIIERGYKVKLDDRRRTFHLPDNLEVRQDLFSQYLDEYGEPTLLRDYQMYGINAILKNHGGILLAGTGAGKAELVTNPILTTDGWVKMGDLTLQHEVITPDNNTSKITGIHPQGKVPIYRVHFHDGAYIDCCRDHLWKVKRPVKLWHADTEWDVWNVGMIEDFLKLKNSKIRHIPGNISIPTCEPIEYRHTSVSPNLDPYLMGVLLGDGSISGNKVPAITSADDEIVTRIQTILTPYCITLKKTTADPYTYNLTKAKDANAKTSVSNHVTSMLKECGVWGCRSWEKFIPESYKLSSVQSRWELIRGLMDTDGTVTSDGRHISYSTTSERLALDMQEVIRSLGGICNIRQHPGRKYMYKNECRIGRPAYNLHISVRRPKMLFSLKRKQDRCLELHGNGRVELMRRIKAVELVGYDEAQCITVDHPDHLYITDNFTVTHNTIISASFTKIYGDLGLRVVTIVPTASLVLQSSLAFKSWGLDCGRLDKDSKELDKTHLVTTWQSLQNIGLALKNYDVVIVDECQAAQASVLSELIQTYGCDSLVRIGLTGTMPEYKLDNLMVRVMLGDIRYEVPAHVLIDKQYLSTIDIKVHQLQETCAEDYFPDYTSEMNYLRSNEQRNLWVRNFVVELSQQPNGNVLMLVTSKQFGKKFTKMFPNAHFVCGDDHVKDRAKIYDLFKKESNLIVITTVQVAGTGLSIDRVFNLVLMDLGKSFTRVIQAVGRGLRRNAKAGKIHCDIHDLSSNLKYSKRHQTKRTKHYKDHQYPYKVTKVQYRSFDLDEIVD